MTLLRLQAAQYQKNWVKFREAQSLFHTQRRDPLGNELLQITSVADHVHFVRRQPLLFDQIRSIGFRDSDVVVHEPARDAVNQVMSLDQTPAPRLADVRRLNDDGNTASPSNRRSRKTGAKQMGMQNINPQLA